MPREPWRDDPEYLGLWRMARQQPDDPAPRFVLSDWREEHGHLGEAWRERVHGVARIADPHTVVVKSGANPERTITARFILIATGSRPARPANIPFNDQSVFDSDSILQMRERYQRILDERRKKKQ